MRRRVSELIVSILLLISTISIASSSILNPIVRAAPSIVISPLTGPRGTAVSITGSGFAAGDAGTYSCITSTPLPTIVSGGTCTFTAGGSMSGSFTVSDTALPYIGAHTITVTGTTTDAASGTFTVTGPKITLNPISGPISTAVTITGSGFDTADSCGTITVDTSTPTDIVSTSFACASLSAGKLSASFTVPNSATPGAYSVTIDGGGGAPDDASASFTVTSPVPKIILNPISGPPGTAVTFTGSNFVPGDAGPPNTYDCLTSTPLPDIVNALTATCTFNAGGQVTGSFTVVSGAAVGAHSIKAVGSSGDSAAATFTVTGPKIILTPTFGQSGSTVTVTGSGFDSGDAGTYDCFSSVPLPDIVNHATSTCTFTATGTMTGSFTTTIPAALGAHTITATGTLGDFGSATFTVTTNSPKITLSPSSGPRGTVVTVTGSGFAVGDVGPCTLSSTPLPDITTATSCTIASGGSISGSFTVGSFTPYIGAHTIMVQGATGDQALATFTATGPTITVNPTSGPASIVVTITGTGFDPTVDTTCAAITVDTSTPTDIVSATFVCASFAPGPTGSSQLSASFTVAVATPGPYTITIAGLGTTPDSAQTTFTLTGAAPPITLSPTSGPVGTIVTVSGSGFAPSDAGTFGPPCSQLSSPTAGLITSAGACTFLASGVLTPFTFTVGSVATGPVTVVVTGFISGQVGQATFTVTSTPAPKITLVPTSGPVGTIVTVSGSGFASGDAGTFGPPCSQISSPTPGFITLPGKCVFTASGILNAFSFTVGSVPAGQDLVQVTGSTSGNIGQATFTVTSTPAPKITLVPTSGAIGTVVTVSGSGFASGDAGTFGPPCSQISSPEPGLVTAAGTCVFTAAGVLNAFSFTVGVVPPGEYVIDVAGASSGNIGQAVFTVTGPTISLSPISGPVGTTVTVSGSGFQAVDAGTYACLASTPTAIVTSVTCTFSSGGSLSGSFQVKSTAALGAYAITATGSATDSASATFTVTSPTPLIMLSPTFVSAGGTVTITGSGFSAADTTPCTITSTPTNIIGVPKACTFSTVMPGVLSATSFTVPMTGASGTYSVTVTGSTGDSASANLIVGTSAPVTFTPGAAPVGGTVGIQASDPSPGIAGTCGISGSPVTFVGCSETAAGVITGSFIVSNVGAGPYQVTVSTTGGVTLFGVFVVRGPFLQLSDPLAVGQPASGPIGTHVTVGGAFFNPSDTTCSLSSPTNGNLILNGACSFFAGAGMFAGFNNVTGSFTVGNVAEGQYVVQASGNTGDFAQAIFNVTAGAFIQLGVNGVFAKLGQPASAPIGAHVSIEGSQFLANDAFNSATCSLGSPSNGAVIQNGGCSFFKAPNGFANVTGSFVVGNVAEGQYVIQVSGSAGDSAQAILNVTAGAFIQLGVNGVFERVGQAASGPIGTHVSIEGSQFLPNDALNSATCSLSSPTNGAIISTGVQGACSFFKAPSGFVNVTGSFVVGNVQEGQYVIQVSGSAGDSAQAVFNVTAGAFIQLGVNGVFEKVGQAASGPIGAHVSIEGSQFLSADAFNSATCSLGSPTNGAVIQNGACSFFKTTSGFVNATGSFVVGNVPEGQYVIQVSGSAGDSAQAILNVTAGAFIQLSGVHGGFAKVGQAASGPIGTHVDIEGSQFLPNDAFNSATCSLGSPSNGAIIMNGGCSFFKTTSGFVNVTGSFVVGNVAEGQYVIQVSGSAGDSAQAIFNVTAGAFIQLSGLRGGIVGVGQIASGPIGTHVNIEGSQFLANDAFNSATCSVSSPTNGAIIVDGACSFFKGPNGFVNATGSFIVGNVLPGQYAIQVSGSAGDSAQAIFNVTLGAQISLSPGTAPPGHAVIVNGTGFLPTDTSCTISSPSSSAVLSGSAGCAVRVGTGVVGGSFIVGNVVPGQYVIQVSGNQGDFAQAVLNVTSGPKLSLSPGSGTIGTAIEVNGTGFLTTDQSCSISSISTPNPILIGSAGCAITVGTGIVRGSFIIGSVSPGEYTIEITGCSGNIGCAPSVGDFAQAVLGVQLGAPTLTLSPASAQEGSTVTFVGSGLNPSDTSCSVLAFNGAVTVPDDTLFTTSTCSILSPGIAQGTFVVGPYATSDISWLVQVQGSPVNDVTPAEPFTVIPDVNVVPTSGTVNTVFTYTGSGFESDATSCTATTTPAFGTPTCSISASTGQVSGSIVPPTGTIAGTYGITVTDNTGKSATGIFTIGTPSALLVLNPASVDQDEPVGVAGTGFNPQDAYCVITSGGTPPWTGGTGGVAPNCAISGGYASGSFVVSSAAPGGYYLISIIACNGAPTAPTTTNPCAPASTLDFASNFLGVTLQTTVTTYSTTTTTSSTTTSLSTTTTSEATSFSYSSTTYSTTGIFFTTYTHFTESTVSGQTTTTFTQTTSSTQTQTTVTVSTTTSFTTVPCGPLPCGFAIQPAMNPAPGIDSTGLLAALLLLIPMLLRRLLG